MIKVGYVEQVGGAEMCAEVVAELMLAGVEAKLVSYSGLEALVSDMRSGEVQVVIRLLKDVDVARHPEWVIAGLSKRSYSGYSLITADPKTVDATVGQILAALPLGAGVAVRSELERLQLKAFSDAISIVGSSGNVLIETLLESLQNGDIMACVVPSEEYEWRRSAYSSWASDYAFNPKEFVPEAGSGVLAYLALSDDIATRRAVKKIHHSEVAEITNIERGLKQIVGEQGKRVAAYCEKDLQAYYHLWAFRGDAKRVRVSSSTTFGLAEQAAADFGIV